MAKKVIALIITILTGLCASTGLSASAYYDRSPGVVEGALDAVTGGRYSDTPEDREKRVKSERKLEDKQRSNRRKYQDTQEKIQRKKEDRRNRRMN